jgi:hypothetical protein
MINNIIIIDSLIFIILGLIHFYWAFGGTIALNKVIPTTIEGIKLFNPAKSLTIVVGIILLSFTYIVVLEMKSGITLLAILFFTRAVGDFHYIGFFKKVKSTSFALYDTKYLSPLCLYLAMSLAFTAYNV